MHIFLFEKFELLKVNRKNALVESHKFIPRSLLPQNYGKMSGSAQDSLFSELVQKITIGINNRIFQTIFLNH